MIFYDDQAWQNPVKLCGSISPDRYAGFQNEEQDQYRQRRYSIPLNGFTPPLGFQHVQ